MFEVFALPYSETALAPYISQKTMSFHYDKHYKNYVDTLNKLIQGTKFADTELIKIIQTTYQHAEFSAIFNNAGQVYNHQFFWKCLSLNGGCPKGKIAEKINQTFDSYENFKKLFKQAALSCFGSGWVWVTESNGKLLIETTSNADTPIARGIQPLLVLDVWEHAYYLDYQNRRGDFVDAFLNHLAVWGEIQQF